jgi:hypothetical protein
LEEIDNSEGPVTRTAPALGELPSKNDPALMKDMKGFNIGACVLTWVWMLFFGMPSWGFGALLASMCPPVGLILSLYLGYKGNELAWRYKHFDSIEEYRKYVRKWDIYGIIFLVASPILLVLVVLFILFILKTFFHLDIMKNLGELWHMYNEQFNY